jgi:hypothetical protein
MGSASEAVGRSRVRDLADNVIGVLLGGAAMFDPLVSAQWG